MPRGVYNRKKKDESSTQTTTEPTVKKTRAKRGQAETTNITCAMTQEEKNALSTICGLTKLSRTQVLLTGVKALAAEHGVEKLPAFENL